MSFLKGIQRHVAFPTDCAYGCPSLLYLALRCIERPPCLVTLVLGAMCCPLCLIPLALHVEERPPCLVTLVLGAPHALLDTSAIRALATRQAARTEQDASHGTPWMPCSPGEFPESVHQPNLPHHHMVRG